MPLLMRFIIPALIVGLFLGSLSIADFADIESSDLGFEHSYLSDTIPDRLLPGHTYPVMITFRNVGLITWENRAHRVGMVYKGNLTEIVAIPAFVEIPAQKSVTKGQNVTFALSLIPVGIPGPYQLPFYVAYRTAQGDQAVTEVWKKSVSIVSTDGISSPVNGSISVESIYDEVSVSIGNVRMGKVPCIIPDLSPGRYELVVTGQSLYRKISVQVEKGTLTRVYVGNEASDLKVEMKKVGIVSDGTLFGYMGANLPLLILLSIFVIGCIVLMIHAVRLRKEGKEECTQKGKKKNQKEEGEYDPVTLEKELLEEYHQKNPLFEGVSPASDPGSGSDIQELSISGPPARLKNVRRFSREMLDKKQVENDGKKALGGGSSSESNREMNGVEIRLDGFEVHPGRGKAQVAALNRSPDPIQVEGYQVLPGGQEEIPIEVPEPSSNEYSGLLSVKIIQAGHSFIHSLQIPYNRGIALLARGVYEKAYEFFLDASKKNPHHIDALIHKARILFHWGLNEEAEAVINQILDLDPDNQQAKHLADEIRTKEKGLEREKGKGSEHKKIPGFPDYLYDRYSPIRLLGSDELATIFLVIRNDNEEVRALKIANEDVDVGSGLYTEISVLYQLRNPNVLKMFRAEFSPRLFLELEYASGVQYGERYCRTLADLKPPLPEDLMYCMIEEIASGLAYIHSKGVRHYHLSPRYILLDDPMTPKISGLMRSSLRSKGSIEGDPLSIRAPEQIIPEKFGKKGLRTDLFQLGTIWYWLMTGNMPYGGEPVSKDGIIGVYLPVSIVNSAYGLYDPLMKALLALDKRDRYSSAEEFLADLRGIRLYETLPKWMREV